MELDEVTRKIIGCSIEVHRTLGPGLLESAYHASLKYELNQANLKYESQVPVPLKYKHVPLDLIYRLDLIVEGIVLLELKSVEMVNKLHENQLVTYLKLADIKTGLLINFNTVMLKSGIKRINL